VIEDTHHKTTGKSQHNQFKGKKTTSKLDKKSKLFIPSRFEKISEFGHLKKNKKKQTFCLDTSMATISQINPNLILCQESFS